MTDFVWAENFAGEKNITLGFRLNTKLTEDNAVLYLRAANVYRIMADGKMIHYGPARAAHGYVREDVIPLKNCRGKHIIAEVSAYNVNNFYYADETPFFCAEIRGKNGEIIASTEDFKCFLLNDRVQKVQRYSYQRAFVEHYKMSSDREEFYAGRDCAFPKCRTQKVNAPHIIGRAAPYPSLEKVFLGAPIEAGEVFYDPDKPVWKERSIDNIGFDIKGFYKDEIGELLSDTLSRLTYQKASVEGGAILKKDSYLLFKTDRTLTGFLELNVTSQTPSQLYIVFDEIAKEDSQGSYEINFSRNKSCNIIKYELIAGKYSLIAFEAYSMRYVKLICTFGEISIDNIGFIKYENPDAYKFEFSCPDPDFTRVVAAAQNTFAQNAVDILMDCPSRERAGWLCDSYFSSRAERLFTGENLIEESFLQNYALSPQLQALPENMIPMCYPSDTLKGQFIPNWAMWYIIELEDYLIRTGKRGLIMESKQKADGIVRYFEQFENSEGLLEDLKGWVFVEWSQANKFVNGVNFPSNMLYSKMLSSYAALYYDDNARIKAQKIKTQIIKKSFNGEFFEDNMIRSSSAELIKTGNITETCQYYAFFCDVADKKEFGKLYDIMFSMFGMQREESKVYPNVFKSNAFIGNYLRLEYLRRTGEVAKALAECKNFFLYMADSTGTLWEHSAVEGSLNHGFASYAANFIIEAVTGINRTGQNAVYLRAPAVIMDCEALIPAGNGNFIHVLFDGKKREIILPGNFQKVEADN